jgi:hypothetical protein
VDGPCTIIGHLAGEISTRRLSALPFWVALSATGRVALKPSGTKRLIGTPFAVSQETTEAARAVVDPWGWVGQASFLGICVKRGLVIGQGILRGICGAEEGVDLGPQNLRSYGNRRQRLPIGLATTLVRPEIFPAVLKGLSSFNGLSQRPLNRFQ